ncbi:NACHT, LRR and PYD domains-containing protein 1b allele 2-like isoform X2 [Gopherus flavomarginatus]|uniref:NACHT, LRR and PYD domains-containing protein 1b allele 2-like isoform X2 n=1 Tax=Gopherus flavomarginatus TaxID=286002 RepID=UPI0021CC20E6|nr:NACHT, LRR and PYD domains-containing protein 1b allele 2-like isoform X2 [Gopherus flavomarginatus]
MEAPGRSDLLRKLKALGKEELEGFKDKLSEVLLEGGSEPIPKTPADPAALTDLLLRHCRGDSKAVLKVLEDVEARLQKASSHPQQERKPSTCTKAGNSGPKSQFTQSGNEIPPGEGGTLASAIAFMKRYLSFTGSKAEAMGKQSRKEDPTWDNWRTDKCKLCPREEDPSEEISPEIIRGPDGNQETYRVHLPGAGSFHCSETKLGLEVRAAVTVQYRYGFWDQHLSVWSTPKWMIAGPLFSIQAEPAGAVAAIHLPHFLCLRGADTSWMQIAHFIEEGMTLEKPMQVRPFHAVLENPSFSLYGVVWGNRSKPPILIHSIVLLYWALKMAKTTLHLYIIPNDHSRFKAVDDYEKQCPSRLVSTSLQTHKPLTFDSCYIVSSHANIEVTPKELEFCNIQAECLQSYMEIYTKDIQGGLEFSLVEKINKEPIWEAHVKPEDATLSVSSVQTQTDEHFVSQHREQLIQRVMAVDGILDSLCGSVLDLEQIQSIRAERSSMEKMRKLYELVPKWDNDCKDRLYQALKEKHRPLVEELEGI